MGLGEQVMTTTVTIDNENERNTKSFYFIDKKNKNMFMLWLKYISQKEDTTEKHQVKQGARFGHCINELPLHTFSPQNDKHGRLHKIL